jgi:hypothetical protein
LSTKLKAHNSWASIFYPYPKTNLLKYSIKKGLVNIQKLSEINQGKGNPHSLSALSHPYAEDAMKFKTLLPLYVKYPIFRSAIRKLIEKKYGILHKLLYIISIPLLEKGEFYFRFTRLPKIIFKTKKKIKRFRSKS